MEIKELIGQKELEARIAELEHPKEVKSKKA